MELTKFTEQINTHGLNAWNHGYKTCEYVNILRILIKHNIDNKSEFSICIDNDYVVDTLHILDKELSDITCSWQYNNETSVCVYFKWIK